MSKDMWASFKRSGNVRRKVESHAGDHVRFPPGSPRGAVVADAQGDVRAAPAKGRQTLTGRNAAVSASLGVSARRRPEQ